MDALIQDETTRLVKHFKLLGCTSCTSCIWWKRLMAVVTHCDVCLQTILSRDFWTWMATYGNHPRAIILGWLPHFCICLHAGCSNDAEESLLVLARGWALDSDSPVALHVCFFGVQIVTEDKVCWTLGIVTFGTRRSELYSLCSSWSFRIVNTALMPAFVSCTIPVRVWVTKHFLGLLPAAFAFSFLHAGHRQEAFAFLLLIHCFPSHYDFVGEILLKTVKTVVFVFFFSKRFMSLQWVQALWAWVNRELEIGTTPHGSIPQMASVGSVAHFVLSLQRGNGATTGLRWHFYEVQLNADAECTSHLLKCSGHFAWRLPKYLYRIQVGFR